MDFGKAFSYPFQDPDWIKKIVIAGVVLLIPIVGTFVIMGWMVEITRRVIRQNPNALPELNFGQNLSDGFKVFVVSLVYAIPAIIFSLPPALVSTFVSSSNSNSDSLGPLVVVVMVCCYGLLMLYSLLLAVLLPAAIGNFVAHESISAGLRFGEVFGLVRAAPGPYLLVLVGTILSGMIGSLGTIACVIGVFLTYAYAMAINGHLYGQAYNEATANRGIARAF